MHWGCYYDTTLDIEVDPSCRRFGCRESEFALQRLVECRTLETERVRLVALRFSKLLVYPEQLADLKFKKQKRLSPGSEEM